MSSSAKSSRFLRLRSVGSAQRAGLAHDKQVAEWSLFITDSGSHVLIGVPELRGTDFLELLGRATDRFGRKTIPPLGPG